MARAAIPRRLSWHLAEVVEARTETPRVRTIAFDVPGWPGHRAGQHVDVRLTAEDGYQAERSYSIASPPGAARLELTVERLDDGEVSPYLVDELRAGDRIELRGPIGGPFTWAPDDGGPLLLVGGGSGIVPLMAMLRARVAGGSDAAVRLVASFRAADEIVYAAELERVGALPGVDVVLTLTRTAPPGFGGPRRRIDAALLAEHGLPAAAAPRAFVCGPTGLVEAVASALVALGHAPERIRTERFGPTGT